MANPFDDDDTGYKNRRSGLDPVPSCTTSGSIEGEIAQYERELEKYMQESPDSNVRSRQRLESSKQLGVEVGDWAEQGNPDMRRPVRYTRGVQCRYSKLDERSGAISLDASITWNQRQIVLRGNRGIVVLYAYNDRHKYDYRVHYNFEDHKRHYYRN